MGGANIVSQNSGGRTYQVVIPFGLTVSVVAFSSFFKLSNMLGLAYTKSTLSIPVLVPAGQVPPLVGLQITGGAQ